MRNAIQSGAIIAVEIGEILVGRVGVDERYEEGAFNLDDYKSKYLNNRD